MRSQRRASSARVIDLYSVKPVDGETLRAAAEATGGRFVVAEDHWPEGGLAEAVLSAFADSDERPRVVQLAVRDMPGSGARRNCSRQPGSTPTTSPQPRASSSRAPSAQRPDPTELTQYIPTRVGRKSSTRHPR